VAPDAETSYNCPEDAGVVYDLKFIHGTQLVTEVKSINNRTKQAKAGSGLT
jgi:hypothetical protein